MAVTVTHPFVSAIADGADATVVRPSNWNATHSISGTLDVANGGTGVTSSTGTGSNVLSASPTFTGTLAAAAITASTTLGVTGTSTLSGNAIISVTDNTNAALRITQLGTGNALLVEDSTNPDSSPFVIDASGNTKIGTATAIGLTSTSVLEINEGATRAFTIGRSSADATGSNTNFAKSRSSTYGTRTIVQAGDILGSLNWWGDDGAAFINAVTITASIGGTPGLNDMPGRLIISTTADGAAAPTERMRIDSNGLVTITNGAVIQGLTVGLGANAVGGNTAVGVGALSSGSLSGASNTVMGNYAGPSVTSGFQNTFIGGASAYSNTTGYNNSAFGLNSLYANISGTNNTSIGANSLTSNTGSANIGLGQGAGSALTTGSNNTIIGSVAGTAGLSDTVIIAAGATERMRIDSTGLMKVPGGISGGTF